MIYFANRIIKSQQEEIILLNDMLNKIIMFLKAIYYNVYSIQDLCIILNCL